ncbi:hypothetical protein KDL01_37485, partial [Actinospica durhamensis]|nr:hypothetical protein [Actinospica durhamensis]
AYDFDSGSHRIAPAPPGAVYPQAGMPPRVGGSAAPPRRLGPGYPGGRLPQDPYTPPGLGRDIDPHYAPAPLSRYDEDDADRSSDRLVPFGLGRHQRRLLLQTGAVVVAVGALSWWAIYTLGGSGHTNTSATGTGHSAPAASATPGARGGASASAGAAPTSPAAQQSLSQGSVTAPSAAPSSAAPAANAAGVESVRVTLLGGSASVPQIAVLIAVTTDGTGQITVTGSYYGADGSVHRTPESQHWTLSGQTTYSFSVPIANSAYCGTMFTFTAQSGGHSATGTTAPGC